jgi:metal-sulfur cluster biosynthetic enzyme
MLYQSTIDKLHYNKSDVLLEIISCQILESTSDPEITMNSVVNLTMSYCTNCSAKELNFIVSYIELANKLIVD